MPRRAFTLVELLVVIAIMITLMSLIMGGVMLAKRTAMRAKAVSLMGAVASAIDQYRSLNNVYPERMIITAAMVAVEPDLSSYLDKDVYSEVFSASPGANAAASISADNWKAVNQALIYQLGDLISEQAPTGLAIDPWKMPLRYRPSKWYPYNSATTPRIDSENPPGQDSYQLWSAGPNGTDDANPGEGGDDIPQWSKL